MTPQVTSTVTVALVHLKDLLYELYVAANCPPLSLIVEDLDRAAAGLRLSRPPTRMTVAAMFRQVAGMPTQRYAVAVATVLARRAGRDAQQTATHVADLWTRAHAAKRWPHERLGRPATACDPFLFGVRRPVAVTGASGSSPVLPPYITRRHDADLAHAVAAATAGTSGCLLLIGEPGSGRARACWEAIYRLPDRWQVWQPAEHATAADIAASLARTGRHTVVWLPDVDRYLTPVGTHVAADRVAAELRRLLDDPDRAPVLVLATTWPEPWAMPAETSRSAPTTSSAPAPQHGSVLAVFDGHELVVPAAFTLAEMTSLAGAGAGADPTLRSAANLAAGGRLTQVLAGTPALFSRYHAAPPVAQAVIHAAMDASRFGLPRALPARFLAHATPGYLPDPAHDVRSPAQTRPWHEEFAAALDYLTTAEPGRPSILTPAPTADDHAATAADDRRYRLAACLDHAGRRERAGTFPPARLWEAITRTMTDPAVLRTAGWHASRQGRLGRAGEAYEHAVRLGDTAAMTALALLRETTRDRGGAHRLALRAADLGDITALRQLAVIRDDANAVMEADTMARDAALRGDTATLLLLAGRHAGSVRAESLYRTAAERGDLTALSGLARISYHNGDADAAETFAQRAAEAGETSALRWLADAWRIAGDPESAERLAVMAAELGHRADRRHLSEQRRRLGAAYVVEQLVQRCQESTNASEVRQLAQLRTVNGSQALAMAVRIAARRHTTALRDLVAYWYQHGDVSRARRLAQVCAMCGDPSALSSLAADVARHGDLRRAVTLAQRAAARGGTTALRKLGRRLLRQGDVPQAVAILRLAVDCGDPDAMFDLARHRQDVGDLDAAEALYLRASAHGVVHAWCALALLHESTGAAQAATEHAATAARHGDTSALRQLGQHRAAAGDWAAAAELYRRASAHGDELASSSLAQLWRRHEDRTAIESATTAAAAGDTAPLRCLADAHQRTGDQTTADRLYWLAYDHGDHGVLLHLPHMREEDHGDPAKATVLALQAAARGRLEAVADLGLLRARCGDLDGAEALYLDAIHRGHAIDLHGITQLRRANQHPPAADMQELYRAAADQHVVGALLVLARLRLAADDPAGAKILCIEAANRGDPDAVSELVSVYEQCGDRKAAALIQQYGLADDGSPASAFLW